MVSTDTYQAARERAAAIDRSDRGRIVVSGADRASYLQGLLTNDVVALKPGEGCYAAYLTPQGRMIADLFVYELGDVILLTVPREQKDGVMAKLDQFIFSEDVQLGDVTESFFAIAIVGPDAARIVGGLLGCPASEIDALPEHGNRRAAFGGGTAIVTRVTDTGEAGYDVYVEQPQADALRAGARRCRRSAPPTRRRPRRSESKPACRSSTSIWTRRRFRSKPESSRARSACRKGATSGRKSSSACSIAVTVASPGSSSASSLEGAVVPAAGRGRHGREPGDRTRHQQHDARRRWSGRSRWPTCIGTFSRRGPRCLSRASRRW